MTDTPDNLMLTYAGRYALRALDLGEAECDPVHTAACGLMGLDPHDSEVSVVEVSGWRDCSELDELGDTAQVWAVIRSAGDQKADVVWTIPA